MSKSRKRRTRRTHHARTAQADLLRDPFLHLMMRVDEAEARGDVVTALELIQETPVDADGRTCWRPSRVDRLLQLAVLGPQLPRWAWSRWLIELSLQDLDQRRRRQHLQAIELAIEVRGGEGAVAHPPGEDPRIKVQDHDWVFRQLKAYDHGGLAAYLRRRASPALVAAADQVEAWAAAPMGGYRFVARQAATTTWRELASGEDVTTPNIGSAALLLPGDHVIGRLVPIEGGTMFETVPLQVPEAVAVEVADDPPGWLGALRRARDAGTPVDPTAQFGFLSDVPRPVSLLTVYDVQAVDIAPADLARLMLRAAQRVLDGDEPGSDDVDVWQCLAREVLSHDVLVGLGEIPPSEKVGPLSALGELLAEPAAAVCRSVVEEASRAA